MNEITALLKRWQLDERMYRAYSPRERERWHAQWLLTRGWSAAQTANTLERDPHTIGDWLANFRQAGPRGLVFEQIRGVAPRLGSRPAGPAKARSPGVTSESRD